MYSTLGAQLDVVEMLDGLMPGADPRPRARLGEDEQAALRPHHAEDQDVAVEAKQGRAARHVRRRAGAAGAAALRPRADVRRPRAERQEDRRRQGRRRGHRSRLHRGRQRRCAPTCRTSSRSATSSASRCSRTRRRTKGKSRPKSPPGEKRIFDARVIPSVAYTDPEIAWVGVTEDEAKAQGHQGRARACSRGPRRAARSRNGRDEGFTKLLFDEATHRDRRRRHRRHARGRSDQRDRARDRDGRGRGRHRPHDPSAPDAVRVGRLRRRGRSRACARTCRRYARAFRSPSLERSRDQPAVAGMSRTAAFSGAIENPPGPAAFASYIAASAVSSSISR